MFLRLLSGKEWTVSENSIDAEKIRFQETVFTLGNGYLGSRGILEEGHKNGYAGTYIAGIYDHGGGQSFELVNAPNPVHVEIYAGGKKLSLENMEVVEYSRTLDIKKATLLRRTVFKDAGRRYEYRSMRFFSLKDMHTGVMAFSFKSLDGDVQVVVKHIIDGTTENKGQAIGDPVKHYAVTRAAAGEAGDEALYLEAKTTDYGISIGMAAAGEIKGAGLEPGVKWDFNTEKDSVERECSFTARQGKRYRFDVFISIYTSREQKQEVKKACLNGVMAAREYGFAKLFKAHVKAWENRWHDSSITIEGEDFLQKALRFNMYHLLIAAPPGDIDVSIAAKTLSGEWYKGHVFWDTEIFVLPFFIFTKPEIAKNLLMYRYRRLQQAREGAQAQGFKGALWPWESASSGRDETPQTWVNFDGTIIPVHNTKREHHIAGDVIYGLSLYYRATGDKDFMLRYGAEMIFETARFWASRAVYDREREHYVIKEVIGPNEFQECVNNNSYTNYLAGWTLRFGVELYYKLKNHPRKLGSIAKKIGLMKQEVEKWRETAEKIVFLISPAGLIEEFEGYFNKKDVLISEWDENGMPVWPAGVNLADAKDTQLVKQADTILLLQLFSGDFSLDVKRINFDYYLKRTTHKSSLSLSSHAIIALELGDLKRAYEFFVQAAKTDIGNVYGNTELGVHAAALGGAWQIAVYGFAGVTIKGGMLRINPVLPEQWRRLNFRLWFKKTLIEFNISKNGTQAFVVKTKGGNREGTVLEIYGERYLLRPGEKINAKER